MDLRWLALGLMMTALGGCAIDTAEDAESAAADIRSSAPLRMNELQSKGTHNSYHLARRFFPSKDLNYNFKPLDVQLESQGVRAFELDLHFDGGDKRFDVHHINWDKGSTCDHFSDCLKALKKWSDANRAHAPLFVQLETKDDFDAKSATSYVETLEKEILTAWPRDRIVTPDDVKGSAASVRDAVTGAGWPMLENARGKIVFYLQTDSGLRTFYTHGDKDLAGRLTFINSELTMPYAAITIIDDPIGQATKIATAVKSGFIVRTRADADLAEPRKNDHTRDKAAFASGAQIVSTDFPAKDPNYDYLVTVPNGAPSRCNPLLTSASCTAADIERLP